MDDHVVLLLHLDHGESEHSYTLYRVPRGREGDAESAIRDAWDAYERSNREGWWDERAEAALKAAGIPFDILEYQPLLIEP